MSTEGKSPQDSGEPTRRRSGRLPTHGALLAAALTPEQLKGWYGGARERLLERVEEAVGMPLPSPLRSLLRLREGMRKAANGRYLSPFADGSGILPLDRIMVAKRRLDVLQELPAVTISDDERLPYRRDPVSRIPRSFWRASMLPVADNPERGWLLAVDTLGELTEEPGSVVRLSLERFDVVATDPGAWLEHLANLAEEGQLHEAEAEADIHGPRRRSVLRLDVRLPRAS